MRVPVRLIALDLDGTLLDSDKAITPASLSVLEQCRRAGILVVLATARSMHAAGPYIRAVQPDAVISNGGALLRAGERTLYERLLPSDQTAALIAAWRETAGAADEMSVQTPQGYYWNLLSTPEPQSPYGDAIYTDFKDFAQDAYKVTAQLKDEAAALALQQYAPLCSVLGFSGGNRYRFAHRDATKEAALKCLLTHLGIPPQQTAAIGDDMNDLGMIRLCGLGVAMGNAIQKLRLEADVIADDNDHDGVAKLIRQRILPQ